MNPNIMAILSLPIQQDAGGKKRASLQRGSQPGNTALALFAAVLARILVSGFDRNFRVSFFALVRLVAPDRAHVSDAVLALLAFAAAGRVGLAGDIALRLLVHAPFGGLGLFSIRHDEDSADSVFADHLQHQTTAQ
jgi:hypothetical protein